MYMTLAVMPPAPAQGGCAEPKPQFLTRKLLSLGLVARLRPRRMLSFLSETLESVTRPSERGCS